MAKDSNKTSLYGHTALQVSPSPARQLRHLSPAQDQGGYMDEDPRTTLQREIGTNLRNIGYMKQRGDLAEARQLESQTSVLKRQLAQMEKDDSPSSQNRPNDNSSYHW